MHLSEHSGVSLLFFLFSIHSVLCCDMSTIQGYNVSVQLQCLFLSNNVSAHVRGLADTS